VGVNVDGDQVLVVHKYFQIYGKTLCFSVLHGMTI